jgi:hypothetical protein
MNTNSLQQADKSKGVSARLTSFVGRIPAHSVGGMGLKMRAVHVLLLRVSVLCVKSAVLLRTHLFLVRTKKKKKTWVLGSTAKCQMIALYSSWAKRALAPNSVEGLHL